MRELEKINFGLNAALASLYLSATFYGLTNCPTPYYSSERCCYQTQSEEAKCNPPKNFSFALAVASTTSASGDAITVEIPRVPFQGPFLI